MTLQVATACEEIGVKYISIQNKTLACHLAKNRWWLKFDWARKYTVVVVLLYGLACTRLQHSKNVQSCIASRWKSNTDNKTLLLLKWSLHSVVHRKYKTHCKNISSKVCGCYMARLTLSKNSNSASLTIMLYRLFTLLSTDGDNNNASGNNTNKSPVTTHGPKLCYYTCIPLAIP